MLASGDFIFQVIEFTRHKLDILFHLRFRDALHVANCGFFQSDEVAKADL